MPHLDEPDDGDAAPAARRRPTWRGGRNALIGSAFVLLVALGMARHEMWRDELQAWAIARASPTLPALFDNLRYEGHPGLWHLLLWPLARATERPAAMQLLHLAVAAWAGWLFLRWAPFALPLRALFLFGYLPLFEHGVLSRNYALALPALWGACRLATRTPRRWPALGGCLALLANTNPYAWLLALALLATFLVDELVGGAPRRLAAVAGPLADAAASSGELPPARRRRAVFAGVALAAAGLGLALWQMLPPPDALYAGGFRAWWAPRAWRAAGTALAGYFPFPDPLTLTPWNSALVLRPPPPLAAALALAWLPFVWWLLGERRARRVFALGTTALLAFTYFVYLGWARHHGYHFLLFLACAWLALARTPAAAAPPRRRPLIGVLAALLVVHLATAAWLFGADLARPFSGARAAAARLASPPLAALPAVGLPDAPQVAVGAYRGLPVVSLATGLPIEFVRWRADGEAALADGQLCARLAAAARRAGGAVAFVALTDLLPTACADLTAELVGPPSPLPLVPSERLATWRVTARR
jgi:hypothetical protein